MSKIEIIRFASCVHLPLRRYEIIRVASFMDLKRLKTNDEEKDICAAGLNTTYSRLFPMEYFSPSIPDPIQIPSSPQKRVFSTCGQVIYGAIKTDFPETRQRLQKKRQSAYVEVFYSENELGRESYPSKANFLGVFLSKCGLRGELGIQIRKPRSCVKKMRSILEAVMHSWALFAFGCMSWMQVWCWQALVDIYWKANYITVT